jgi:hypothetical protein
MGNPNVTHGRKIVLFTFMNIFSIVYYILVKTYFAPHGEE